MKRKETDDYSTVLSACEEAKVILIAVRNDGDALVEIKQQNRIIIPKEEDIQWLRKKMWMHAPNQLHIYSVNFKDNGASVIWNLNLLDAYTVREIYQRDGHRDWRFTLLYGGNKTEYSFGGVTKIGDEGDACYAGMREAMDMRWLSVCAPKEVKL